MKVKLGTIEVTDLDRRAISLVWGRLATRCEVRLYFLDAARSALEEVRQDYLDTREELEQGVE
tara:strand:+ start:363 stop:551 length:189 start_codon:yes stop_codon:yes gene_type:complete